MSAASQAVRSADSVVLWPSSDNASLIPLGGRIWSGPTGWLSESPCSRRLSSSCWHRPLHTCWYFSCVLQNPTASARPWMTALAEAAKVGSEAATNLEIFFQCFTAFPMTHDDTNFVHLFLFLFDKPHQTRLRCEMCQVQVLCRRIMQYQAWCGCIYRRIKTSPWTYLNCLLSDAKQSFLLSLEQRGQREFCQCTDCTGRCLGTEAWRYRSRDCEQLGRCRVPGTDVIDLGRTRCRSINEVKMEQMFRLASTEGSINVGLQSWSWAGSGTSSWAELSRTGLLPGFYFPSHRSKDAAGVLQMFHKCFTNVSPVPVLQNTLSVGGADAPCGRGAGHQRSHGADARPAAADCSCHCQLADLLWPRLLQQGERKPDTHEMKHRVFSVTVM